ncbi:MAG: nitroreductase [bacterium]|nr:nitroreductase [bacterium]
MNEAIKTIAGLRTVRRNNYNDTPIPPEDLETILAACIRTANASARQSYSIIVVDEAVKRELKWPGSSVLLFCVDFSRLMSTADFLNQPLDTGHIQPFITGTIDTSMAAQTAVIAAKSLGIDSRVSNEVYMDDPGKIFQLLDLPEKYCFPLLSVSLGYPKKEPASIKGRVTKGVIHYGKYKALNPEELEPLVLRYDDPENHLALIDNWERMGFSHYLEWFFAKWSPPLESREKSGRIKEMLERIGLG